MTSARWLAPFRRFLLHYPEFAAPSWLGWRSISAAVFGETPEDVEFVQRVTARRQLPTAPVKALFAAAGRGSGKTRFPCALLPVYFAVGREYDLAPGEQVYVTLFSPTRRQSLIAFRYILGLLHAVPSFAAMITRETDDTIELANGIVIDIGTADYRTVRGRSMVLAVVDEGAFLPVDENSATPDTELLRALRPALARVPGSLLLFVSSPYAQRGELYRAFQRYFGHDDIMHTLVVRATTRELNPLFDADAITEAFDEDAVSAASEYDAMFRNDVETYLAPEAIKRVVVDGRFELLPEPQHHIYRAFFDFAGGSRGGDSATMAIGHTETIGELQREVLDVVREVRPPFSPEEVCAEFAELCRRYHVTWGEADHWGGQFPIQLMQNRDVHVRPAKRTKSEIYRDFLPLVMSGRVELLDHGRLITQLVGLERRVARGGKDSYDHMPGQNDDVANAAAGVLVAGDVLTPKMRLIPLLGF